MITWDLTYTPKARIRTAEEHSLDILKTYHQSGVKAAAYQAETVLKQGHSFQRNLIFLHGLIELMNWNLIDGMALFMLVQQLKTLQASI